MRVLAFAASLRNDSYNRKVIRLAAEVMKSKAAIEVDYADFREFEMPMYDGDMEDATGTPEGGLKLTARIRAADAIVISTPEYNGSIPGSLKNAIDWVSREEPMPWEGKPLLLLGASPGGFGALRGLLHARVPFESVGAFVFPEMFGVARAGQAFDDQGNFKETRNQARLEEILGDFLAYAKRLQTRAE